MQVSRADLGDLRTFLAVAKHRSLKQAGLELGVTSAAMSQSLSGIERRLGVRLLDRRTRKGIRLTKAGQYLLGSVGEPFVKVISVLESLDPSAFNDE
jgi:DNA-binding transcriptional LysR family regulator